MLFPWTADSGAYRELGLACARHIVSEDFMGCYNGLRPVGILLYYAFPSLVASDPVTVTYVTLLLNLICLLVLILSAWTLFSRISAFEAPSTSINTRGKALSWAVVTAFWLVMLVQTVGYLPLRLADIQSLCLLMAGIAIASSGGLTPRPGAALIGGALAGCSVLFRQNYVIVLALMVFVWFAYSIRLRSKAAAISATLFALGAGTCLLQLFWVYLHTGIPWFYEPQAMLVYAESTKQPYVELIAYSLPAEGAYAASLARPVSDFEFLAVKFFHGLFKFYWTPSLGAAPVDHTPHILDYSSTDLFFFQAIFIVVGLASLASVFFARPWLSIVVIAAFGSAAITAIMSEVEYRYFLFSRVVYIIFAFSAAWMTWCWYRGRTRSLSH